MRLTAITAVALLIPTWVCGQERPEQPNEHPETGQAYAQEDRSFLDLPPIWFREWKEPDEAAEDKVQEDAAREREKADLVAQQGMNVATQSIEQATWLMFYASCASVLVGVAGTIALVRSVNLTRRATEAAEAAVEVARQVGRDQSRAYLTVDQVELGWGGRSSQGEEFWRIYLHVKNAGATPARWYTVQGKAFVNDLSAEHSADVEANFANLSPYLARRWPQIMGGTTTVCPLGQDKEWELAHCVRHLNDGVLNVIGVIRYETIFDEISEERFEFFVQNGGLKIQRDAFFEKKSGTIRLMRAVEHQPKQH